MRRLSIISPFFNSEAKCSRLLATLPKVLGPDVEAILVDDGSTDSTVDHLYALRASFPSHVEVVVQENRGPGGARNSGLRRASGEYVWFVDSDDDIRPEAVQEFLRVVDRHRVDVVDFNYLHRGQPSNSMDLAEGTHDDPATLRRALLAKFGRICTKIFKHSLLVENSLHYPEFCIYEDNALLFAFPFFIKSLYKSNTTGYEHHEDSASVTRAAPALRFFDRLFTAEYGLKWGRELATSDEERALLDQTFVRVYIGTIAPFMTRIPGSRWTTVCRIMRMYRDASSRMGITIDPLSSMSASLNFRIRFRILWILSSALSDQTQHFESVRLAAWGRPFPSTRPPSEPTTNSPHPL